MKIQLKYCSGCDDYKHPDSFYKGIKNGKEALNSRCKVCIRERRKRYYRKYKDRVVAKNKIYYQKNKERLYQITKKGRVKGIKKMDDIYIRHLIKVRGLIPTPELVVKVRTELGKKRRKWKRKYST
jgi:hypothetical protein